MRKFAELSASSQYRYLLGRVWDEENPKRMIFLMLNPSTADAEVDDPTIRRCIGFAKREGMGGITVLNLFAYRTKDPKVLAEKFFPVGPANDRWICSTLHSMAPGSVFVCGWGAHGEHPTVSARVAEILNLLARHGVDAQCLGTTQGHHPRHPLYTKNSAQLSPLP